MNSIFKYILISSTALLFFSCGRDELHEVFDDGLAPVPPSGLLIYFAVDGEIGIEWERNPEPDIAKYGIYMKIVSEADFHKIGETSDIYFELDSLDYDSTYYFAVTAIDLSNRESPPSETVYAVPKNYYRPYPPQLIEINARNWNDSLSVNLNWLPPIETDISSYEIYRCETADFTASAENLVGFSKFPEFIDRNNLKMLVQYYYKITAVDKGNLKSVPGKEVSDVILNKPLLLVPGNNSALKDLKFYKIKTVSRPAAYKIVLQSNEIYGILKEINFSTEDSDKEINIDTEYDFEPYKDYYVQVLVYTASGEDPNTFSTKNKFNIIR